MSNSKELLPPLSIGSQIKKRLLEMMEVDGLKRTQRWAAIKIGMSEAAMSNKISGVENFKEDEILKLETLLTFTIQK